MGVPAAPIPIGQRFFVAKDNTFFGLLLRFASTNHTGLFWGLLSTRPCGVIFVFACQNLLYMAKDIFHTHATGVLFLLE